MQPAAAKAPFDYLLAALISSVAVIGSFWVQPSSTRWIVFGFGVVMVVSVLVAAARPVAR